MFKNYEKKAITQIRDYVYNESLTGITVGPNQLVEVGGKIARDPENHKVMWYLEKGFFEQNYQEAQQAQEKTLHNSDISGAKKNVEDLKLFGDGDLFKLISEASSKNEGWMKSTKAMEIPYIGCVVKVTTQNKDNIAEALVFVPGISIQELKGAESRKLIKGWGED